MTTTVTTTAATSTAIAIAVHNRKILAMRKLLKGEFQGMKREVFVDLVGKKIRVIDAFGNWETGFLQVVEDDYIKLESRMNGTVIVALDYIAKIVICK